MRPNEIYKITTNKSVYNKVRKQILEHKGEIHCSYCPYHNGENFDKKIYGGYKRYHINVGKTFIETRYPSWKLVSKNKKQWMKKPTSYKVNEKISMFSGRLFIEIEF